MPFDRLLARELRRIALGLSVGVLGSCGPSQEELEAGCDGGELPKGYRVAEGVRYVKPGAPCPPHPDKAWPVDCCPVMEPKVICRYLDRIENMVTVNSGTGVGLVPASEAPEDTGWLQVSEPVDVCVYEGVFYTDGTCCGRPLLDQGAPVVAPVREGNRDWAEADRTFEGAIEGRGRVAAWWLEAARLEHASVASFARFTLDLLALGAPPELLAAAQRAALDEIDHARRCFALASRALGRLVGPGPMTLPVLGPVDRAAFAEALIREGCVGETLAAVDAAARRAEATEPEVLATLDVIRRDEAEHASLAWRTLAWLVSEGDEALRERVDRVFAEEELRFTTPVASWSPTDDERAWGLIDPAVGRHRFADAFARVIRPAVDALPRAHDPAHQGST